MSKFDRPTVLVVEDEEDLATVISEALKGKNIKVLWSGKVSEAVMKLSKQKFNTILLDMHIKEESGETVLEYLHSDPKGFNFRTPVIVVSGFVDADLMSRIKGQIAGVVVKPFDAPKLVETVQASITRDQETHED